MKIFAGKSGGGGSGEMGVPVTKHPLERAEKWSVDSYPVEREVGGPVLLVTVHGEFEESEFFFLTRLIFSVPLLRTRGLLSIR